MSLSSLLLGSAGGWCHIGCFSFDSSERKKERGIALGAEEESFCILRVT